MPAEPVENAGAGAGSIDERRCAAPSRHLGRVDTERGPAPIDMRVEIDQPGHDDQPADIDGLRIAGGEIPPDFDHLSAVQGNVGRLVAPARRVDDAAASEYQIRHRRTLAQFLTCGIRFAQRSRIGKISSFLAGGRRTVMRVTPRSRLCFKTSISSGALPNVTDNDCGSRSASSAIWRRRGMNSSRLPELALGAAGSIPSP